MKKDSSLFKKLLKICVLISIVILFTVDILYLIKSNKKEEKEVVKKEIVEETEKNYKVSLIAAGDNLIHSSIYKDANKNASYKGYDFKPIKKPY